MKTFLAIILVIMFLFFVAKADMPANIADAPKALLDKAGEIVSGAANSGGIGKLVNLESISAGNIISGAKNFISNTIDKITETIKTPIENKVNDILCPQK